MENNKKIVYFKILLLILFFFVQTISSYSKASINQKDELGFDPWLTYLHDFNNSGFSDSQMSSSFSKKWTINTLGESSNGKCVIFNGRIYFASMMDTSSRDGITIIQCNDINTNEEVWETEVKGKFSFSGISFDANNNQIFFATTAGVNNRANSKNYSTIYCLSAEDGSQFWETYFDGAVFGSLTISDDSVFCQTFYISRIDDKNWESLPGDFLCFEKETGLIKWVNGLNSSWDSSFMSDSPAALIDKYIVKATSNMTGSISDQIIRATGDARIYLLNQKDGYQKWNLQPSDSYILPSVSTDENIIYVSWTDISGGSSNLLIESYSLDKSKNWSYKQKNSMSWYSSPFFNDQSLFVRTRDGEIICLDKKTGKFNWKRSCYDSSDGSAMAVTKDYIFSVGYKIASKKNNVPILEKASYITVLNTSEGEILWEDRIDNEIIYQVALYGKYVLLSGQKHIFCYEAEIPFLEVDTEKLDFGKVPKQDVLKENIKITNTGNGNLEGLVKSNADWIEINPKRISQNSQTISIQVDASKLTYKAYVGEIEIITNGGSKKIQIKIEIIDDTPPVLTIESPPDQFVTKKSTINIKGRVWDDESGIKSLTINDESIDFDTDGNFEVKKLDLQIGKNKFKFIATNKYDLQTTQEMTIIREKQDETGPVIIITQPSNNQKFKTSIITITGYVKDSESGIDKVFVNNNPVEVREDGQFEDIVTLNEGINKIIVKAIDKAGNISNESIQVIYDNKKIIIVILTIGEDIAFVNDEIVRLETPPMIINGRTMVPVRFISEAFGADVKFIPHPTNEIQIFFQDTLIHLWINNKKAKIEYPPETEKPSKIMNLESPPIIKNGRTIVPLRFIGEVFGAKIDWDARTQTITLTLEMSNVQ